MVRGRHLGRPRHDRRFGPAREVEELITVEIEELTTDEEFRAAWTVMRELRGHLDEQAYMDRVGAMRQRGYRMIAARDDGRIVALAGIGVEANLYYGPYMWVYDLVTAEDARSKGHGLALMRHVEELARAEGCETLGLSSALHRLDAHRFYLDKVGMDKVSYTFKMDLTGEEGAP